MMMKRSFCYHQSQGSLYILTVFCLPPPPRAIHVYIHSHTYAGEILQIMDNSNSGWWFAHFFKTGKEGYIPSNYIARHDEDLRTLE